MDKERTKAVVWSWQAISAFCCFAGGILAALIGSMLTAITWIVGAQVHPWLRGAGTTLLIVTIPLLIFAGYCLDWSESAFRKHLDRSSKGKESGLISLVGVFTAAIFLFVLLTAPIELRTYPLSKRPHLFTRPQIFRTRSSVK